MLSRRSLALIAGAFVVALLAAGCGSSGGNDEITASSIGKAEFIKQADTACEKNGEKIRTKFAAYLEEKPLQKKESKAQTEVRMQEIAGTIVVPPLREELDEIRALGVPNGDVDQVQAILDAIEESIEQAEEDPKKVVHGSEQLFAKASKLAEKYGLKVCGQG